MECIQIIVQIEDQDVLSLLKEKGRELENLLSIHGKYAVFSGENTFSWKWLASNLSYMDDWFDADCIEFHEYAFTIVAALWQYDGEEGVTKWYLCHGCSDDLIDDPKVQKVLADVLAQQDIVRFENKSKKATQIATVTTTKIVVPSREQMTREWLLGLTTRNWQQLQKQGAISAQILDEWDNPIFKELQSKYQGFSYEFPKLAQKAIEDGKGWAGVEAEAFKVQPRAKPVLARKK
jgi:hypothetical protein